MARTPKRIAHQTFFWGISKNEWRMTVYELVEFRLTATFSKKLHKKLCVSVWKVCSRSVMPDSNQIAAFPKKANRILP